MCESGDRKYIASTSRFVLRRCSICSISSTRSDERIALKCNVFTCDAFIQYLVFLNHIIDELSTLFINHQHFPLLTPMSAVGRLVARSKAYLATSSVAYGFQNSCGMSERVVNIAVVYLPSCWTSNMETPIAPDLVLGTLRPGQFRG